MGDSWDSQVSNLIRNGFEVDYIDHFVREEYFKLINSLDYYLYMGLDEGQMGFIDAVAAGINTIVTPQGYHLDADNAITHPFTTYNELLAIFLELQNSRSRLVNSVASWNWYDYTLKHVELWEYLLGERNIKGSYKDGLNSLLSIPADEIKVDKSFIQKERRKLRRTKNIQQLYIWKNTTRSVIKRIKSNGIGWFFSKISHKFFQT